MPTDSKRATAVRAVPTNTRQPYTAFWVMLLQNISNGTIGVFWDDFRIIFFWVRPTSIVNPDFMRKKCTLQSPYKVRLVWAIILTFRSTLTGIDTRLGKHCLFHFNLLTSYCGIDRAANQISGRNKLFEPAYLKWVAFLMLYGSRGWHKPTHLRICVCTISTLSFK